MIFIKIYKRKTGYEIEIPTNDDVNGNEYYCFTTLIEVIKKVSELITNSDNKKI